MKKTRLEFHLLPRRSSAIQTMPVNRENRDRRRLPLRINILQQTNEQFTFTLNPTTRFEISFLLHAHRVPFPQ